MDLASRRSTDDAVCRGPWPLDERLSVTLTLPVGTLTDQITVTGEAPLIEVTQTTLGASLTTEDIENLPTQGREMLSLMQLIPGMTPQLEAGNFEGTLYR